MRGFDIEAGRRAQLRDSEARFRAAVGALQEGFFIHGPKGSVMFCNTAGGRLLARAPDAVVGLVPGTDEWPIVGDDGAPLGPDDYPARVSLREGTAQRGRVLGFPMPSGETRWLSVSSAPVMVGGEVTGAVVCAVDVTEQRRAEAEIAQQQRALEDLIVRLSLARDVAESGDRAKTAFLAMMSHELRTPLNGVLGMNALAQRLATDPRQADFLQKARLAAQRLLGILNDVLDLAKIESEPFTVHAVAVALPGIVDRVMAMAGPAATGKGLAVTADVDPRLAQRRLVVDPIRLGQILGNLVGNAVKFTAAGSVAVRALLVDEDAGTVLVRFEVEDTGIGIAAADRQRLFVPFEQVDATYARHHGGTGLGLAIAKRLLDRMGGEIGVSSEPGIGSTFHFTLRCAVPEPVRADDGPVDAEDETARSAAAELAERHAGAAILLVGDDRAESELVTQLLRGLGLRVEYAASIPLAQERVRAEAFVAVLLDTASCDLAEAAAGVPQFRSKPGAPALPLVALAEAASAGAGVPVPQGVGAVLVKPLEPDRLFDALRTALSEHCLP